MFDELEHRKSFENNVIDLGKMALSRVSHKHIMGTSNKILFDANAREAMMYLLSILTSQNSSAGQI